MKKRGVFKNHLSFSKNFVSFLFVSATAFLSPNVLPASSVIKSPDQRVAFHLSTNTGHHLQYKLTFKNRTIVDPSPLGVVLNGSDMGEEVELKGETKRTQTRETYPWRGVRSKAVNHCNGMKVNVKHRETATEYAVEIRVFNCGAAFRYLFSGKGNYTVSGETTAFTIPEGASVWYQANTNNYEAAYRNEKSDALKAGTFAGFPVTFILKNEEGCAAITEAALRDYSGMTVRAEGKESRRFRSAFQDDASWSLTGPFTTPWRVIMVADNLNGLVNCDIVHNLCAPPSKELAQAPWIRPGRAVWSWWSEGTGDLQRNKWYVDRASELGFEYNLVDAGWEKWKENGRGKWHLIKELIEYAKKRNVDIWLWKHFSGIKEQSARRDFLRNCSRVGAAGVKIDFMDSESRSILEFYEDALACAAENRLMVNFHGANKPAGEPRTWPNEMTREGIQGLEYNKWSALPPRHYATLPFTRYLAGHGDFTVCTLRKNRLKGTTAALQLATAIVYDSPLMHWADTPDLYLESKAADVIREIPTVWDETIVLPESRIGVIASFARRLGDRWFVGIINGGDKRSVQLQLAFLDKNRTYRSVLLGDKEGAPEAFVRTGKMLTSTQAIPVSMSKGGGFVAMFQPVAEKPGWKLVFNDEFNGDRLDPSKWNPADPWGTGRNNELQAYVPDAFEVKNGILTIKAEKRQADYAGKKRNYTSGMMTTYKKFSTKYGWFEIRCRVPRGKGMWPAFWLLPEPLGWPPEIDVLEILGHETTRGYFTHHWRASDGKHRSDGGQTAGSDFAGGFHVFQTEWKEDSITWYVDGRQVFTSKKSVPKELPMYLLVNLAVGGDWPGAPNKETPFPGSFDVDYIRVYKRK